MNNGSNQKITGYIKVSEPTVHNLMSDVDRRVLRITKRKDEIVLDLTVRDKKSHYYYDDYNSKFFMPEPCFNDSCRDIERLCGQDICDLQYGIVSNINSPEIDPFPPFPPLLSVRLRSFRWLRFVHGSLAWARAPTPSLPARSALRLVAFFPAH